MEDKSLRRIQPKNQNDMSKWKERMRICSEPDWKSGTLASEIRNRKVGRSQSWNIRHVVVVVVVVVAVVVCCWACVVFCSFYSFSNSV